MWPFKKKPKEVMHLEDLPNTAMKKLIFPDPLQQVEHDKTDTRIQEEHRKQQQWIEQLGKPRN